MTTMNIDQANKVYKSINQNVEQGKYDFNEIDKFMFEFIELMNDEFSQTNTNLFASLVNIFIQNDHNPPTEAKKLLRLIGIYLNIIENPSVYKSKGATLI